MNQVGWRNTSSTQTIKKWQYIIGLFEEDSLMLRSICEVDSGAQAKQLIPKTLCLRLMAERLHELQVYVCSIVL